MIPKYKKNILILVLLLVLSAVAIGFYLFNKGPVDVKNSSATKINAAELYEEFNADTSGALKKYAGKILEVNGILSAISLNQKNEKVLLLKTNMGGAFINCTLEEDPGNLKVNDQLNVRGICSGMGQGDADLGIMGDVYLTRSFIIK